MPDFLTTSGIMRRGRSSAVPLQRRRRAWVCCKRRARARNLFRAPFARRSAILVFPVARFSFGEPFERGLEPAGTRLLAFCLGDPFDVFPLVAGAEVFKSLPRPSVFFQSGTEIGGNDQRFFRSRPGWTWHFDVFLI